MATLGDELWCDNPMKRCEAWTGEYSQLFLQSRLDRYCNGCILEFLVVFL